MLESVADSGIFLYNDVMGVRNMANETDQALDKKTLIQMCIRDSIRPVTAISIRCFFKSIPSAPSFSGKKTPSSRFRKDGAGNLSLMTL